jgi:uncharacterized protein YaaN involved in tellurite resistance
MDNLTNAENTKVPTLTLDSEERTIDLTALEPSLAKDISSDVSGNLASAGAIDESMLSAEEKKQVDEFYKKIDVSDIKLLNSYGAGAQKGISTFSSNITKRTMTKDAGDVGESLRELKVAIEGTTTPDRKGILGIFKKGKQKLSYLVSNFQSVETNIQRIEKDLRHHQQVLTQDVYVLDQMYKLNLEFYQELTMYIIAGKKALSDARNGKLIELREKAELSKDQLDIEKYRDYERACNRFEKRVHDLEVTRLVSLQQAPQIRIIQDSDQQTIDKLRSDIINTIPLWRNQMVVALGIQHTTDALNAQSALDEMTNEMFRRNSETLKQGAIDAALASERDIIDIDTLRKVNADIISSINEVVKIHEEGNRRRADAQNEMVKLEEELKQALLDAGQR